jgi:DNA repair photolyase
MKSKLPRREGPSAVTPSSAPLSPQSSVLSPSPLRGRGASWNPQNRFETLAYVRDEDAAPDEDAPRTIYLRDPVRTVIAHNDSPDVGFTYSINPYRGCEHGCIYCFARPTHEYLGFSAGLDFETKIVVKEDAPELLREELLAPKWAGDVIAISGVTDPFQPIERKLEITRRCLAVLAEFRNPTAIITKNHLVTRDIDILSEMAKAGAISVAVSVTTLDASLANIMEPRTTTPQLRLEAIAALAKAGIPTTVMVAPVVPAITDHEMPAILKAARDAGAISAGFVVLRLPWAVAPLFERWLEEHFPDRKDKVLNRIRDLRGGKLYDPQWGVRGRGEGIFADQIASIFDVTTRKLGLNERDWHLSSEHFRKPSAQQSLF